MQGTKNDTMVRVNGSTNRGRVFCFGELLLRMSPSVNGHWIQQAQMPVYIGGAELNVATALAGWNIPTRYCTALPGHYLAKEIIEELQKKDIDTSAIRIAGERIGAYYLSQGADLKNAGVIYDRAYSSFSMLEPGMINWEEVLKDCSWFHFSAISPALNKNLAAVCREALEKASGLGLTISVDLNYRSKLWQYGLEPLEIMPELVQHCDLIMGNLWAVESLLGIASPIAESAGFSREKLVSAAEESILKLQQQYPRARSFAYTFRLEKEYWAVLKQSAAFAVSGRFAIENVIDKVGSGDCFMAALIYGLYRQDQTQAVIDFAASAAIGKLQEKGDATRQTEQAIHDRLQQKVMNN